MNSKKSKMDVHVRFRIEEVREAMIRRRRALCLRRFAFRFSPLVMVAVTFWYFFRPYGATAFVAQLLFWIAGVFLFVRELWKPLRKPISNHAAALLIDRHHPELEDRVTAMVALDVREERLAWMETEFMKEARHRLMRSRFGADWNIHPQINRTWQAPVLLVLMCLVLFRFPFVWQPFYGASWALAQPYEVDPGDVRVQTGADQIILVRGGHAGKLSLLEWRTAGGSWQQESMSVGDADDVHFYRFTDIRGDIQYRVTMGSWKSKRYEITTWLPAEVTGIDLTYHYPEYLDLPSREVTEGGQITALEGSTIDMQVSVNKPLKQAEMVFESGRRIQFQETAPLIWSGSFVADENDVYHIELRDRDNEAGIFQPGYEIVVRRDKEPAIRIEFPYNDLQVSPLDEVPFTFRVSDDFGLSSYGLRYQVEGRDPVIVEIGKDLDNSTGEKAEHLLYLEELNLSPGDLINWTVWATDRKPDRPEYETMAAPYFLEIRPFRRLFREAVSDAGGGARCALHQSCIGIACRGFCVDWASPARPG